MHSSFQVRSPIIVRIDCARHKELLVQAKQAWEEQVLLGIYNGFLTGAALKSLAACCHSRLAIDEFKEPRTMVDGRRSPLHGATTMRLCEFVSLSICTSLCACVRLCAFVCACQEIFCVLLSLGFGPQPKSKLVVYPAHGRRICLRTARRQ